jgi:hypothetical protein
VLSDAPGFDAPLQIGMVDGMDKRTLRICRVDGLECLDHAVHRTADPVPRGSIPGTTVTQGSHVRAIESGHRSALYSVSHSRNPAEA